MNIIEKNYNWNGKLSFQNQINTIILHHAEAIECTADDIHSWHLQNKWTGIGYHFFVRKDGKIYRGRPENTIGSHTKGNNINTLGICFEGNFKIEDMNYTQLQAGSELVCYLKEKYNITEVKRHKDFIATDCPGDKFPFDKMVNKKFINNENKENLILDFQKAAMADGFDFPKYGCDGYYGKETEEVMKVCVVKKRTSYKNKNTTKLVQRLLSIKEDGLCGEKTQEAIKLFQMREGLVVDGICGYNTWKVLLNIKES